MTTSLHCIKPNAAGIDIGSKSHFVAVPSDRDSKFIREFKFFTEDLYALSDWLKSCKIETVAMEATGSYWISLYEILEKAGFEVYLVNSRHTKNVAGRKTDVQDCQWIQQLHSYGLLKNSFIPDYLTKELRHYVRHRDNLIRTSARQLQLIQKALIEMNLQIQNVISDIAGDTGMKIVRAICAGERDAKVLAEYRDPRCKSSKEIIEKSLCGHYKNEILFSLEHALSTYDHYQEQIRECDKKLELKTKEFTDKSDGAELQNKKREGKKNKFEFEGQEALWKMLGVNLLEIPGMNVKTAMTLVSEIGTSVSNFRSAKHFASWLGLAPNNKISGGKKLSGKTVSSTNRIKQALRMAAQCLERSNSSLGVFLKRMKARVGAPKALTAVARKLAVIIYNMMSKKTKYEGQDPLEFEKAYRKNFENRVKKQAEMLDYILVPSESLKAA